MDAAKTVRAFFFYCRASVSIFAFLATAGAVWIWKPVGDALVGAPPEFRYMVITLWILTWAFLAMVHIAALRTPIRPWAWSIFLVILVIGMTTLVLWPFALPLAWYWLKPETQQFFGRTPFQEKRKPAA